MITRSMVSEYLKYILPTMLTFTMAGIYGVIDGVFVGHAVGDAGLAGVNVAYPLVCLILAAGTGLGMGGGVISSIARGKGETERSQRIVGVTLFMLVVASIPILMLYSLFAEQLCRVLGGQGETLSQAVCYLKVIALGAPFQVLVTGCTPLIRNKGMVAFAMCVQVFAGFVNVVLDYLFVMAWGRGTAGAAEATVVSQAVAFLFVLGFFLHRDNRVPLRDLLPDGSICAHILKLGAAPFGLTLLPEVSTVVNNISLSYYGGETALAAYAVIAYVAFFVQIMIQSVGDGSQPLISVYRGAGDADAVRRLRNTNYLVAIAFGFVGLGGAQRHPVVVRRLGYREAGHRVCAAGVLHLLHLLWLHAYHHLVFLRGRRFAFVEHACRRRGDHRVCRGVHHGPAVPGGRHLVLAHGAADAAVHHRRHPAVSPP